MGSNTKQKPKSPFWPQIPVSSRQPRRVSLLEKVAPIMLPVKPTQLIMLNKLNNRILWSPGLLGKTLPGPQNLPNKTPNPFQADLRWSINYVYPDHSKTRLSGPWWIINFDEGRSPTTKTPQTPPPHTQKPLIIHQRKGIFWAQKNSWAFGPPPPGTLAHPLKEQENPYSIFQTTPPTNE